MTTLKYNARDCVFQIENPASPGTYVAIGGLNTFTKSRNSANTDTTTYASAGDYEQQIMQRGKTLKLAGFRLKDPTPASRPRADPR
jgi:predicted secreted protein